MKIAITSYAGKVGKTTLAAHLFAPRMENSQLFAVETYNETAESLGVDVQQLSGKKYRDLFKKLFHVDNAIVDVGSSNIEGFLTGLVNMDGSHFEFDYFIVPVTGGTVQQRETCKMIAMLSDFGIAPEKIIVVLNRVEEDAEEEFSLVINYIKREKNASINTEAAIFESELFDVLGIKKISIEKLLADQTDYKELRKNNPDASDKEKNHWADMHGLKALARSVNKNLDAAYAKLFR